MTLNEFILKYSGQTVGYPDGKFIGECLSIVKRYIKEVFEFDPPPSGSNSAYGYWLNFPFPLNQYFKKIPYSSGALPIRGDIVIWNTNAGNGFGHISIFLEGDDHSFRSLEQNWGGKHTHIQEHNYLNVVGWLRSLKEPEIKHPEVITSGSNGEKMAKLLEKYHVKDEDELDAKIQESTGLSWGSENAQADTTYGGGFLGSARRELTALREKNTSMQTTLDNENNRVSSLLTEKGIIEKQIEQLQLQVDSHSSTTPKESTIVETPSHENNPQEKKISNLLVQLLKELLDLFKSS